VKDGVCFHDRTFNNQSHRCHSDTTGAECGQFAGAYWGESGIPLEWRQGLARQDMIEKAIDGLLLKDE
jgi:hypothetical protein